MRAVTLPAGMTIDTPSSTRWSPNHAQASTASRVAAPGGGPPMSSGTRSVWLDHRDLGGGRPGAVARPSMVPADLPVR